MYTLQKKESEAINMLRVIFTVMVVYIHSHVGAEKILDQSQWVYGLEYAISESICRCAVPGFFLISSILLYRRPFFWKNNLKKKIRGILIPYIIMNTFWILFFLIAKRITVFSAFFNTSASDIYNWGIREWLNAYLGFDGLPVLGQTWFLRDLFVVNVLAVLLKKIIDKIPKLWIVILSLLWIFNFEIPVFCISIRAVYFFSLGYYIVKYNIHVKEVKRIPSYILSIAYLILVIADTYTHIYVQKTYFINLVGDIAHQAMILLGLLLLTQLAIRARNITNNFAYKEILKYNFCIYLFHEMTLTIFRKAILKIAGATTIVQVGCYFFLPIVIIIGCIVFSYLLEIRCPQIFEIVTGSRANSMKIIKQDKK